MPRTGPGSASTTSTVCSASFSATVFASLGSLILSVFPGVSAWGQEVFLPGAQVRLITAHVTAEIGGMVDSENERTLIAPGYDLFEESFELYADGAGGSSNGFAGQTSNILSNGMTAFGTAAGSAYGLDLDGLATASASSRFDLQFRVLEDAAYTLTGTLTEFDHGTTTLTLSEDSGTGLLFFFVPPNSTVPINETGVLPEGTYRIVAQTYINLFGDLFFTDYGSGSFSFEFDFGSVSAAPDDVVADGGLRAAPNPFTQGTRFLWDAVPGADRTVLVFDAGGRMLRRLTAVGGRDGAAEWDGRDEAGRPVAAGTYWVRIPGSDAERVARVVRVR